MEVARELNGSTLSPLVEVRGDEDGDAGCTELVSSTKVALTACGAPVRFAALIKGFTAR